MIEYNGAMMQFFHWYTSDDGFWWKELTRKAPELAKAGFTSLWLPPAYKGAGGASDVGYGVYDLFDLGEFDQKGSIRTKYGTRDEYLEAIRAAKDAGMQVYADIVFNHKLGADREEEFNATPYDPENRNKPLGEMQKIKAWTHFTFPGRKERYSTLKWHWWHFNAADHNAHDNQQNAVYLFEGKQFHKSVDPEKGNFDYLMGCNLDISNPDVKKELFYWGEWYFDTTLVDGFRFDAVKHVQSEFFAEWLNHLRNYSGRHLFAVGEYWSGKSEALDQFIERTDNNIMLFDVVLHYNFAAAGQQKADYDLSRIFENTLVKEKPDMAVTLVSNHDTQPLQALESRVEAWFKPLAYALILLRKGGYPCVFAADYFGATYTDSDQTGQEQHVEMASHQWMIDKMLHVRRTFAYGDEHDYFDNPNCIGWVRTGNEDHPGGAAVVLSNSEAGSIPMQTSAPETAFVDITGHIAEPVITDPEGWGVFSCPAASVSIWVPEAS